MFKNTLVFYQISYHKVQVEVNKRDRFVLISQLICRDMTQNFRTWTVGKLINSLLSASELTTTGGRRALQPSETFAGFRRSRLTITFVLLLMSQLLLLAAVECSFFKFRMPSPTSSLPEVSADFVLPPVFGSPRSGTARPWPISPTVQCSPEPYVL